MTDFDQFWEAYPRHDAKKDARKAWDRIHPTPELLATILKALEWQTQQESWLKEDGQYVPLPATWLRGERWEDERRSGTDRRHVSAGGIQMDCPHDTPCASRWACGTRQLADRRAS